MGVFTVSLGFVLLALPLLEAEQICFERVSFNRENPMFPMAPDHDPETGALTYDSRSRLFNKITVVKESSGGKVKCFSITADGDPEYCGEFSELSFDVYIYYLTWLEIIGNVKWYDNTEENDDYQRNGLVVDDLIISTTTRTIHHTTGEKTFKYDTRYSTGYLLFMSSTVDTSNPSKPHKITFYYHCTVAVRYTCLMESYPVAVSILGAMNQSSPISNLAPVAERYNPSLWAPLAQVSCDGYRNVDYDRWNVLYGKECCLLLYMLEQIAILHNIKTSLMNHADKSLLRIDRFDSSTLLSEARKSLDFHNLMTNIQFNNREITNNGRALGNYFNTLANYDKGIQTQDQAYLTGTINTLTNGVNTATNDIKDKVKQIIEASVSISAIALVQAVARLAAIIVEQMNPLGVLFGNFDVAGLNDAMDQVAEAGANVFEAGFLLGRMDDYVKHMQKIKRKFAGNAEQLITLAKMVEQVPEASEQQLIRMAEDFVGGYGAYTPQVTLADLVFCTEILQAVVSAACDIIDSSPGLWATLAKTGYSITTQDCLITPVKIEQLGAYYDELYAFQFDLVAALAGIVRAELASRMSSDLTATNEADSYDVRTAAIGAALVHINYQSLARERCNELQYKWGGKLQPECKQIYINNADIPNIISNNERTTESESTIWAYIPMSGTDSGKYIDMAALVRDKEFRFQLPFEDTQWMMDYGWLPADYDNNPYRKEVSYFVKSIDVYIPGVRCTGGGETWLGVDVINAHPTRLFVEDAPDKFSVKSKVYAFTYLVNSNTCAAGPMEIFKVKDINLTEVSSATICVESRGELDSAILPSLYSIWNFRLRSGCELEQQNLDYEPLITFKIKRREVLESGLDMCWPPYSRCTGQCQTGTLSYTCS